MAIDCQIGSTGVHNLGISLPFRNQGLHLQAAQGPAYSCWVMYAELGGEEVRMEVGGRGGMESSAEDGVGGEGGEEEGGRWMEFVEEWEKKGKKGSGPPGTREDEVYVTSTTTGDGDYVLLKPG